MTTDAKRDGATVIGNTAQLCRKHAKAIIESRIECGEARLARRRSYGIP